MWSTAQPQTSALPAHLPAAPIQSLAKQNRKPSQLVENNHHEPKAIASFLRVCCHYTLLQSAPSERWTTQINARKAAASHRSPLRLPTP